MAKNRTRIKNRQEAGRFMALPFCILESENFLQLSATATRLLIDVFAQYNGANNGDFIASLHHMKTRGWRSKQTLNLALQELLHMGMIIRTKQGGLRSHSRYAVSWLMIDQAEDISVYNFYVRQKRVPGLWRESREPFNKRVYKELHKQKRQVKKPQEAVITPFPRRSKRSGKSEAKK